VALDKTITFLNIVLKIGNMT